VVRLRLQAVWLRAVEIRGKTKMFELSIAAFVIIWLSLVVDHVLLAQRVVTLERLLIQRPTEKKSK
jgi:hypothetical protein